MEESEVMERKRGRAKETSPLESVKKAKQEYYSITSDGACYYLENQEIKKGSRVDAWFDDGKKFFCGIVEGFTKSMIQGTLLALD